MIMVRNLENAIPASAIPRMGPDAVNSILGSVAASARTVPTTHQDVDAGTENDAFRFRLPPTLLL